MGRVFPGIIMDRKDVCDNCQRKLAHGEHVTVIIPDVEVSTKTSTTNSMHLKLSKDSLTTRSYKVYCQACLNLRLYFGENDA